MSQAVRVFVLVWFGFVLVWLLYEEALAWMPMLCVLLNHPSSYFWDKVSYWTWNSLLLLLFFQVGWLEWGPRIHLSLNTSYRFIGLHHYPFMWMFGWRFHSSPWHPHVQRVWNVCMEALPQAPSPGLASVQTPSLRKPTNDPSPEMLKANHGLFKLPSPQNKQVVFWSSFTVSSLGGWKVIQESFYPLNVGFSNSVWFGLIWILA